MQSSGTSLEVLKYAEVERRRGSGGVSSMKKIAIKLFNPHLGLFVPLLSSHSPNFGIASQDGGNYEFTSNGRETMWLSVIKTQWHVQILWSIAQKRLRTKSSFVHSFCFLDKIHVIYCIYLNRNCRRTHMGVGGMGMVDVGRASVFILLLCHNNLSLVRHRE